MADQRNFRSSYLEKVGIKGVEEVKAIEILLKEQPLDTSKLIQFCQRFPVPALYRPYLWKILLGVMPPHQQSHEFVMRQRTQQYNDLHEALMAMRRIAESSPLPEVHLRMFLIEDSILPFDEQKMLSEFSNQIYMSLSSAMSEVTDDPVDLYWLTSKFYILLRNAKDTFPIMQEKIEYYLQKEDNDGRLMQHLKQVDAFTNLPFKQWFASCYAGVLPESSFERVWDKVIGGSFKILTYTAVAILLTFKRPLLSMTNMNSINQYLAQIHDDSGDLIVNKAVDIWQKYGNVMGASKADSPGLVIERGGSS